MQKKQKNGMEKYENLGLVGEGSYGMVLKCRHKDTGQLVAIKKFLENEDDKLVKKIAMREVKMLKQLRHDNLVNLIEVFRRKKRLYLVFEFVDHTVLDELEKCPNGLDENTCRKILWQVLKGTEFCHLHNIIHRDIKPENILVSKSGIVKICDFGFARTLAQPGETYTDYVATRWYRAPELLVGDTKYGKAVDIWAVGCLFAEMLTGEPLFPGDSDIDQLYHIIKCFGNLTARHREIFLRNPLFVGMRIPEVREVQPLEKKFTKISSEALDFLKQSLRLDPDNRPTSSEFLKHSLFTRDGFSARYQTELRQKLQKDSLENYRGAASSTSSFLDSSTNIESTSKTLQTPATKKKKPEIKDSLAPKDSKKETDEKVKKKKSVVISTPGAASSSTPVCDNNEKPALIKNPTPSPNNTSVLSLPPASINSTVLVTGGSSDQENNEKEKDREKDEKKNQQQSVPSLLLGNSSIPLIHQPMPIHTLNVAQGSSSGNGTSSHLAASSFPHSMSTSVPTYGSHQQLRLAADKGMKKVSTFPKKVSQNHQPTIVPQQGIQGEKTSVFEKPVTMEKVKFRSPDRVKEDRALSLPEVKGATDVLKPKEKVSTKKSTVATIPQISNVDPPLISSSIQEDNHPDNSGLPTVS
ncbi:cyclin-dependent kinase-like 2 isoform X3 [Pomacea canaliculata]|uniref:cyclin-dependent kinase-like 2 isoform X3 n=1 Tax=Pomacea canaliculata TaxID=400727 RepID=UPI000D727AE4|nr:cyclin-dependent kinase-like 2 isoform X3 [Pomacea canaliculata]